MKTDRRKSRELAFQTLYALFMQEEIGELEEERIEALKKELISDRNVKKSVVQYAESLFTITKENSLEINKILSETADNWDVERFSKVDKSLLHLAVAELLYFPEVPAKVVINEALEMARSFSSDESVSFINGILDSVRRKYVTKKEIEKADKVEKV
ncbi:MAG: transcription antitermination factor NusB [Candidatus Marinimicrobia bacterium]|nr:transcription antitermination factor NusB [Candidatus Neomarinimicrobiota bacterium]